MERSDPRGGAGSGARRHEPITLLTPLLISIALFALSGAARADDAAASSNTPSSAPSGVLSIFDVLTTPGAASATPSLTETVPPHDNATRPLDATETPIDPTVLGTGTGRSLSPGGAAVLLDDARRSIDEGKTAQAREILRDILSRRSIDDPSAQSAALLMAQTSETPAIAEPYLQLLQLADVQPLAAEAARTALAWSDRAQTKPDGDDANDPPALRLIALAEQFAFQSKDPAAPEGAILARAVFYVRSDQPVRAWETLSKAESSGVVKNPDAPWLALRGDAALAIRRHDDARESYARLAARFPANPETPRRMGRLGLLQELAGDPDAARRSYAAYRASPDSRQDSTWIEDRVQSLQHPVFPPAAAPAPPEPAKNR